MPARSAKRSTFIGLWVLLLAVAPVMADSVRADADQVTAGSQIQVDLGSVTPGAVIHRDVDFTLVCGGLKHADPGQTVTLSVSSSTVPAAGGSISATDGVIGPVPDDWTSDVAGSASCASATTLDSTTPSHVTLTAPGSPGLDFQFTLLYAKALSPAGVSDSTSLTGTTSVTFVVDVEEADTTAPTLVGMPADLDAWTNDPTGMPVGYDAPTATDDRDPAPTVACTPPPFSFFTLGTTTVTCTATDASQNSSSATFDVTVHLLPDTTAPVLDGMPADIEVWTADPNGTSVDYTAPTATDDRDPTPVVGCDPQSGATFPVGNTTVRCTATDESGNSASASFAVTVNLTVEPTDTTPPVLSGMPGDVDVLTTDAAGMVVEFVDPTATDDVDPAPNVGCLPASGTLFPVGTTTVTCTATDADGNSTSATFAVAIHLATAAWSEPIGSSGSVTVKSGHTLRLKAQSLVDGVQAGTEASFVFSGCGSDTTELTVAASLQSGRWTAAIGTGGLGFGCHTVSLVVDGFTFGSIDVTIEAVGKSGKPQATPR